MVTMSQKSSVPQAVKSVSQALMSDTPMIGSMAGGSLPPLPLPVPIRSMSVGLFIDASARAQQLNPKETAVLFVDCQNEFASETGNL
jgi:hypothetical protein